LTLPSIANIPGLDLYPTGIRNYARVIAGDQIQFAADAVLERSLGVTRVAVLDEGTPWSVQADHWFTFSARRLGLRAVSVRWNGYLADARASVARIRASGADGVFVAGPGDPDAAVAVRRQLPTKVPLVVTDWIGPWGLRRFASHADGIYASTAGMPDSALPPAGRRFVAHVGSQLSYTAAYGGGAAELLLAAIARSDGTRASVSQELLSLHIRHGILGDMRIDRNGDPVTAPVTIFRMKAGARNDTGVIDNQGALVDRVVVPPPNVIAR
jgi:ABC-type branched-subunit amino acid transport system substrate-binding protein